MLIIPALDIINKKLVRLSQGKYDTVRKYNISPLEQAKIYDRLGFEWIHIVDLIGSKKGKINTVKILEEIKKNTGLKIEFGGGIRTQNDVLVLSAVGLDMMIIGSLSIINKPEFESLVKKIGADKIIVAVDVMDYYVKIKGWTQNSNVHVYSHIEYCKNLGIENFLCTDIKTDGMFAGPNLELYKNILSEFSDIKLTASGGVRNVEDVNKLNSMPLRGVVIGKAIYENKIDLKELARFVM